MVNLRFIRSDLRVERIFFIVTVLCAKKLNCSSHTINIENNNFKLIIKFHYIFKFHLIAPTERVDCHEPSLCFREAEAGEMSVGRREFQNS
jgi:hypothetical protein